MQNKGAIWIFTVLLTIACLYQLSFSWVTSGFEKKAAEQAVFLADSALGDIVNDAERYNDTIDVVRAFYTEKYLKDNANEPVYPVLGMTYQECKESEINLGLDLKGGMSVTLEVSIPDLILNLSDNDPDETFRQAIKNAKAEQANSTSDFITLFEQEFTKLDPNASLALIFHGYESGKFPRDATNEEIIEILREESKVAINNTERIIRSRIDRFGVVQPTLQKLQFSGRILVELPGVKDKERVMDLLQSTANLEFWETYNNADAFPYIDKANQKLSEMLFPELGKEEVDTTETEAAAAPDSSALAQVEETVNDTDSLVNPLEELELATDSGLNELEELDDQPDDSEFAKQNPLINLLQPSVFQNQQGQLVYTQGSRVGFCKESDTAKVNEFLAYPQVQTIIPNDMRLMWSSKPTSTGLMELHAIQIPRGTNGKPKLDGSVISDASQDFSLQGEVQVRMDMKGEGPEIWRQMTAKAASTNPKKSIAIVLDDFVVSSPQVNEEIGGGTSTITMGTGDLNDLIKEGEDLANILEAGALPAPARIIEATFVGPSLGKENISTGLMSFLLALVVVLIYMAFYYSGAGLIADIALVANLFFLVGALASLQAALTLPGIAGIVLTIGISVDANVLIYERIREELRHGKMLKSAVTEGYNKAYAAIIDANLTTLLTAIVLFIFGSGPIKGFATTLIIGIFTSLFSAIFITRLLITGRLDKGKKIAFSTKLTESILTKANFGFIAKRKVFYVLSGIVIAAGIYSMATRSFNLGVDFTGGRSFVVEFQEPVNTQDIRSALASAFVDQEGQKYEPEVKTYGNDNTVKITTNYMVDVKTKESDVIVEEKLMEGLASIDLQPVDGKIGEQRKVDPTISDDIRTSSVYAISFSLVIIFLYIVFRFRRWQFGLGALVAMTHDVLIVLGVFSLLYNRLPFTMEIDQAFIAAILTVVGYSINDTVVVFDRIREYLRDHKRDDSKVVVNKALNSTLSRTINTSMSTFLVLLMIFLFGGTSIQGFVFALMVGVVVGTYSSLFIAAPSVVDLTKNLVPKAKK